MEILFHTIALEPARWTPQRVSQPLFELLPALASAGIRKLEVYEPHLALAADEEALPLLFSSLRLEPVILSSYLNVNPAITDDAGFEQGAEALEARVRRFGFRKIRLFPGPGVKPDDEPVIAQVQERIAALANRLPDVEFLLETHDGSIADSPERLVRLVCDLGLPNVALLFQPTVFESEAALRQLEVQRPFIRHLHLQNRAVGEPHRTMRLAQGAVPWKEIIAEFAASEPKVMATLEFIPSAICSVADFNFEVSLAEALAELDYVRTL